MSVKSGKSGKGTPCFSPISTTQSHDLAQPGSHKQRPDNLRTPELDDSGVTSKTPLDRSREMDSLTEDSRSRESPAYTEQWEDYFSSPRKSEAGNTTNRSRESGRLSPNLDPTSVDVGQQPLTIPRFNEPLKLKKGRQFVDYETPAPTVVYVPHRSSTHGRWTNVTVQRANDGRFVVIEQRPIHTQFTAGSESVKTNYGRDIFGAEKPWTKKKAPWSWSTKGNTIDRQTNRDFYEPYLPPMRERYKHVDSQVGSLDNYYHNPGGGAHKVPSFKLKWDAKAKVNSLPATARDQVSSLNELRLPSISPRYGASADSGGTFTSIHYTPGGNVILRRQRYDAKSQVGSLDNISHTPSGGNVSIPRNSVTWKKEAKVGSLDNVTHLPKSSNVQVFNQKLEWNTESKIGSLQNADHSPGRRRFKVPNFQTEWGKTAKSKVGSMSNVTHRPRDSNVQIIDQKLKWKAKSKVESRWKMNFNYQNLFENDGDNVSMAESYPYTI